MKYMGIDYGRKKIGIAMSEGMLAEPYTVFLVKNIDEALSKISHLIRSHNVENVVIGISEGDMAEETKNFSKKLQDKIESKIIFQDETLSTKEAQRLSIESGKKRKRRREMEDAYSATTILQSYLDM